MGKVYIRSAVLLSGEEPDFRQYIPPMQARRMGAILKRALVSAKQALSRAELQVPDAVLCGTGLGCMEITERILASLKENEEGGLSPTDFMLSTHNTIASTIAIHLGCKGYNCTYSQGDTSFENALLDAWTLIAGGEAETALVCANDEMTEITRKQLQDNDYFRPGAQGGWLSVALVLSASPVSALCELADVRLFNGPDQPLPEAQTLLRQADYLQHYPQCPVSAAAGLYQGIQLLSSGASGPVLVWNDSRPDGSAVLLRQGAQN